MLKQIRTVTALSLIALICINTVGCGANSINTSSKNEAFINNSNEDIIDVLNDRMQERSAACSQNKRPEVHYAVSYGS